MPKKISIANLVMLAGGVITLLFSFFAFFKFGSQSSSAWDTDGFAFATTIPAILAIAMIAWSICELTGVKLPDNVLTFTGTQMKATWGIGAAGTMLAWITTNGDKGIGYWLMLIGSLAMAAGAVMALLGKGTDMVNIGGSGATASGAPAGGPPPPPPYMGGGAPPPPPPPPV